MATTWNQVVKAAQQTENILVPLLRVAQPCEAVTELGNDENMDRSLRLHVTKRETDVILVHYDCRYFSLYDFVKDCFAAIAESLCL